WTLAAFAIGAVTGVLVKRTVPAIAASLAAWTGLDLATVLFLRAHYAPEVIAKGASPGATTPWVVNQWFTSPNGAVASQTTIRNLVQHAPASLQNSQDPRALINWLSQRHYTQWFAYQPQGRFWHFQLIEGGWLLALALLLGAATVWLVRRRAE